MFKFNIGDKIRLVGDGSYFLDETETLMNTGDIVTIKDRRMMEDWARDTVQAYSFEEDEDNIKPDWLSVEENFELVNRTLKSLLHED